MKHFIAAIVSGILVGTLVGAGVFAGGMLFACSAHASTVTSADTRTEPMNDAPVVVPPTPDTDDQTPTPSSEAGWHAAIYLMMDGKPVAGGVISYALPSEKACVDALRLDAPLQAKAKQLAAAAVKRFGSDASIVLGCILTPGK